jgi:N6-L-threonylcarbamoyladenine synthase
MNILAIETSCDETAISIIQTDTFATDTPNFSVLCDLVISQIDLHAEYGGVFPALAKREHAKNLVPLFKKALQDSGLYYESEHVLKNKELLEIILEREPVLFLDVKELFSNIQLPKIDLIMVTYGPGLAPALWVGVNFARALSVILDIPIVPVNHMEGHISSILLQENYLKKEKALLDIRNFEFPLIALLISGGHTQIVLIKNWGEYHIIGETIDDAVGEAFDKVARMLGMTYPGGPKVSLAAEKGRYNENINLPRPMLHSGDYRFSFSGLKTAVRYLVEDLKKNNILNEQMIADVAYDFQHAVSEVLIKKTLLAIREYSAKGLIIGGGVSANKHIVSAFEEALVEYNIPLYLPERKLCGDNALMIASAGFINYWKKKETVTESEIVAQSNLKL